MTRSTSEQEAMLFLSQRLDDLRTLEAKKSQGELSETDLQEWQNLYKLVVPLYGQRHQQLIEQRRALRIPYRLKLDVVNQSGENFHAMSVDISSTGFALTYIERMKADERVQLRTTLPPLHWWQRIKPPVLETAATVRWKDRGANRVGLEIAPDHPHVKQELEALIFQDIKKRLNRELVLISTQVPFLDEEDND